MLSISPPLAALAASAYPRRSPALSALAALVDAASIPSGELPGYLSAGLAVSEQHGEGERVRVNARGGALGRWVDLSARSGGELSGSALARAAIGGASLRRLGAPLEGARAAPLPPSVLAILAAS